jgi:hypothetical protein
MRKKLMVEAVFENISEQLAVHMKIFPSTHQIILYSNYVLYIATTCFGLSYDHHQVAYNHDKKLKIEQSGII